MAAVVASKAQLSALDDLMPTDDDMLYEEELLRNPYSLKMWWRYIQARTDASAKRRYVLYERALKALPGSYKVGGNECEVLAGGWAACCWLVRCCNAQGQWLGGITDMLRSTVWWYSCLLELEVLPAGYKVGGLVCCCVRVCVRS